jgi:hypothetical protein
VDKQSEKSTTENEAEKEEEEIVENNDEEEEEEEEGDEEDVQSFVTALENENDHVTDSINDLHLGHDDDGKKTEYSYIDSKDVFYTSKGWITPSNVQTVKSKALDNGTSENSETIEGTLPVACITTDFSMQVSIFI